MADVESMQDLARSFRAMRLCDEQTAYDLAVMAWPCVQRRKRRAERRARQILSRKNRVGAYFDSETKRRAVYGMAEGCCAMCSEFVPYEDMTIGHVIPASWGGRPRWDNVQMECEPCNRRKAARIIPRREGGVTDLPWPSLADQGRSSSPRELQPAQPR